MLANFPINTAVLETSSKVARPKLAAAGWTP